jgi:hypothetical protein
MAQPNDLLAVLVDADNVPPSKIGAVLAEVARFGTASVKRVRTAAKSLMRADDGNRTRAISLGS